jgi:GxxExxY protein
MPLALPSHHGRRGSAAPRGSGNPEIFSQEDQKDRRLIGFTNRPITFGTTQSLTDRLLVVNQRFADCSSQVISACIEVHREIGPGLLEAIYEECLCDELSRRNLPFERQKSVNVAYKGRVLEQGYRTDVIVGKELLVEVKAVDALAPIHVAQVVTYLRLCNLNAGLLVNFNAMTIRSGLRRVFRTPQSFCPSDLPVRKSRPS